MCGFGFVSGKKSCPWDGSGCRAWLFEAETQTLHMSVTTITNFLIFVMEEFFLAVKCMTIAIMAIGQKPLFLLLLCLLCL